jgi:GTP-binding protein
VKIETAEFVHGAVRAGHLLKGDLPEVAFVGRSNVGKSSLLNRLLDRRALARISKTPGRTQAVNYFLINRRIHFVDLPGYGFAKASKSARRDWATLMDAYLSREGQGPVLLVQLIDGKVGATDLDIEAHRYLGHLGHEMIKVATKIDKVPRSRRVRNVKSIRERLELPDDVPIVPLSAVSGEGTKDLWRGITAFLDSGKRAKRERRADHDQT